MASAWPPKPPPGQVPATVSDIQAQWAFTVWELSSYYPAGRSFEVNYGGLETVVVSKDFKLRIIFAPPDVFGNSPAEEEAICQLYRLLCVPDEFAVERKQSVSHSFGAKTSATRTCVWFHFLCKNIDIKADAKGRLRIGQNKKYKEEPNADEDYAYLKSGFVVNASGGPNSNDASGRFTTLVCFGATPHVRLQLDKFTDSGEKELASSQPYLLFAPILSGLYADHDEMAWKLNDIFASYESKLLTGAYDISNFTKEDENIFASLHYLAKYCFVLIETVTSLKLVTENINTRLTPTPTTSTQELASAFLSTNNHASLLESIQYTQSLLQSTHLRLNTLRLRIKNAINLACNLGADKDTKIMMADSHAMKLIAFMTAFLLPATAVASILGSNMFDSNDEEGVWTVKVNAAFWMWCVVTLPVTACLVVWLVVKYHLLKMKKGTGGSRGFSRGKEESGEV